MWESNTLAYTVDDDIVTTGYADQPMYGKVALKASSLKAHQMEHRIRLVMAAVARSRAYVAALRSASVNGGGSFSGFSARA